MFQPTMINPVSPVREQVVSRNEESGGISPLDIDQYLSRLELAKINYLHDNAADGAAKDEVLVRAAKMVCLSALVTEHAISPEGAERMLDIKFAKPEAQPINAFDVNTIDHVRDYLQFAYKHIRTEIFVASMEKYQAIHKLYVPVEKISYFSDNDIIEQMLHPEQLPSIEEAELEFQKNPMIAFAIMYAMSTHQVYATVPLPEFRSMMLPMSYQLWKSTILSDEMKNAKATDLADVTTVGKTVKLGLKNHVVKP